MPENRVVAQRAGMFSAGDNPPVEVVVPAGANDIQVSIQSLYPPGSGGQRADGDFIFEKYDGTPLAWTKSDGRTGVGNVSYPYSGLYVVSPSGVPNVRVRFEGDSHEFSPISVAILVYAPPATPDVGGGSGTGFVGPGVREGFWIQRGNSSESATKDSTLTQPAGANPPGGLRYWITPGIFLGANGVNYMTRDGDSVSNEIGFDTLYVIQPGGEVVEENIPAFPVDDQNGRSVYIYVFGRDRSDGGKQAVTVNILGLDRGTLPTDAQIRDVMMQRYPESSQEGGYAEVGRIGLTRPGDTLFQVDGWKGTPGFLPPFSTANFWRKLA